MEEEAPPGQVGFAAVQVVSFSDPRGEEETRKEDQDEADSTVRQVLMSLTRCCCILSFLSVIDDRSNVGAAIVECWKGTHYESGGKMLHNVCPGPLVPHLLQRHLTPEVCDVKPSIFGVFGRVLTPFFRTHLKRIAIAFFSISWARFALHLRDSYIPHFHALCDSSRPPGLTARMLSKQPYGIQC